MRRRLCLVLLACALALRGEESPEERKLYAIASRFIPPSMARDSAESPHERPMRIAVARGILDASGTSCVVAVYANAFDGSVRILVPRHNGSYRLAGDASRVGMVGDIGHVELKDVDGDGFKEIVASFAGLRGPYSVWVLKWNGKRFINLTPIVEKNGARVSALVDAVFEDLNGDGKLELVASNPYNHSEPSAVYTLRKGAFQKTGTLVFWERYIGGFPRQERSFDVIRSDIPYTITIVNGDEHGDHRVTDGAVLLNGDPIVTAGDIATRPVTTTVHLRLSNQVEVLIKDPRQTLLVTIAPGSSGTPVTK